MKRAALRRFAALSALALVLAAAMLPPGHNRAPAHAQGSLEGQTAPGQMCDPAAELVWQFFTTWMTSPDGTAGRQLLTHALRESIEGRPNGAASLFSTQPNLPLRPAEVSVAIASSEGGGGRLVYTGLTWYPASPYSGHAITVTAEEGVLKISAIRSTGAAIATSVIGERRFRAPTDTPAPTATPMPDAPQQGQGTAPSQQATQTAQVTQPQPQATTQALCAQAQARAQSHTHGVQATVETVAARSTAAARAQATTVAQAQSPGAQAQAQATAQAAPVTFVALSVGGDLVRFSSAAPGAVTGRAPVTGLLPGETLLGVDFRPADRRLYSVGSTGWVYAIDPVSGAATRVGSEPVSPAPAGTTFGIAFQSTAGTPTPGQPGDLHLFDTTGRELVISVDPVLCSGCRRSAPGITRDGPTQVVAAAYQSRSPASADALYVISSSSDTLQFHTQMRTSFFFSPAGPLGVDTSDLAGLAIAPNASVAYAALTSPDAPESKLYTVDLSTGAAREVGAIGGGQPVHALAIAPASLPGTSGLRLPATGGGPVNANATGGGAGAGMAASAAVGTFATAGFYALRRRRRAGP